MLRFGTSVRSKAWCPGGADGVLEVGGARQGEHEDGTSDGSTGLVDLSSAQSSSAQSRYWTSDMSDMPARLDHTKSTT